MTPLDRHERAVLQFSGGRDSLACLHLLRPFWDRLVVMWCNTGAAFPEVEEQMRRVREMVPHFHEVKASQPEQVEKWGWPVQVVPVTNTPLGRAIDGHDRQLMQPYLACCWENFWRPMQEATMRLGATLIIRGQRNAEKRKSPLRSGAKAEGIEVWFPIEDWSDERVKAYLAEVGADVPAYYETSDKSLDCWSCTAFLDENASKIAYMQKTHPAWAKEVKRRLEVIQRAVKDEIGEIDAALDV